MMKPLVIDYLRRHTLAELEEEHGICSRISAGFDKISLNYDMISAKKGSLISEQCRGMVVRPMSQKLDADIWKKTYLPDLHVLAWPMDRFYNHGDSAVADVNWSDPGLRVYEKLDGTCVIVYWDPFHMRWHAATRAVSEADLPIYKGHLEINDTTYSQLFLRALIETREATSLIKIEHPVNGFDDVIDLDKEITYVFELVSPWNQVVVAYPSPRAYLLAARHTDSGIEIPIEAIQMQHVLRPQTWAIHDAVSLAAFVDSADPSKLEGAVACDSLQRRLKVKNKIWCLASRSKDTVTASVRSALEAIILEKIDDIVPLVPKDVGDKLMQVQEDYLKYCKKTDCNFAKFKQEAAGSRKDFAKMVMGSGDWTAPYFHLWEKKADNAHSWIKDACEKGRLSPTSLDAILSRMVVDTTSTG